MAQGIQLKRTPCYRYTTHHRLVAAHEGAGADSGAEYEHSAGGDQGLRADLDQAETQGQAWGAEIVFCLR
jgi:hypothetical protein